MHDPGRFPDHRYPVTRRRRRLRRYQRLSITVGVLAVAVVLLVAYGTGGAPGPHRLVGDPAAAPSTSATSSTAAPRTTTTTTVPPTTTTTTGPGTLPQTTTLPSATTPQFHAEMADLWRAVVADNANDAAPAFFPLAAYVQLKTIPTSTQDWQHRLFGVFSLDVGAAHGLLGPTPSSATLVSVNVPTQYAHWVTPGVCYNRFGYYEVPNARVVYKEGGVVKSFGIASMISWRGQWYVVHFGAVLPTTRTQGVVDAPATGPGTSAYSSTC